MAKVVNFRSKVPNDIRNNVSYVIENAFALSRFLSRFVFWLSEFDMFIEEKKLNKDLQPDEYLNHRKLTRYDKDNNKDETGELKEKAEAMLKNEAMIYAERMDLPINQILEYGTPLKGMKVDDEMLISRIIDNAVAMQTILQDKNLVAAYQWKIDKSPNEITDRMKAFFKDNEKK